MVQKAVLIDDWPNEYLTAVGKVAVAFTSIEYILRLYIKSLIGAKFDIGMGTTIDVRQFRQLCITAEHLFKIRFPDDERETKEFDKLLSRCQRVAKRRNELMHRLWTQNTKGQIVALRHQVTGGKGLKAHRRVIRVRELEQIHRDIKKLRDDLLKERERWPLLHPA